MSKFLDSNGVLYLWQKIKSSFVQQIAGKGLSSEDFTHSEKIKLEGLQNYILPEASTNSLGGIKVGTDFTMIDGTLSLKPISWDSISDKPDFAGIYTYKGSVATFLNLPASGNTVGDVWNVEANDMNYAWTGSAWDPLGGSFEVEAITNAEIDTIVSD